MILDGASIIWRSVALAGLTVLGLTATGCSSSSAKVCSLIGAESSVQVAFDRGVFPETRPIEIVACVDQLCGSQVYDQGTSPLSVAVPSVPRDADVNVSVAVSADSRPVFSGSTATHTRKLQPNGPGCPPIVWIVALTAHAGSRLTS